MAKRRKNPRREEGAIALPVDRYFPDSLEIHYSDDLVVQHSDQVFFLSFFQVERPIALTEAETARLRKLRAKCVARIVVTPEQMWKIIIAFHKNFKKYADKYDISIEELIKAEAEEAKDIENFVLNEDEDSQTRLEVE
jgi:hypothetical protein